MKKRTICKLKSLFGGKSKLKRQLHQPAYSGPASRSPSPSPPPPPPPPASYRALSPSPPPPPPRHPPSPPVPTSPVAPTAPEPPPGPRPLHPCAICARTFLPESLGKHVRICEKMAAKKRKTFDSSRQRREGTDLAQFLPKNFGLPENSPFLEKSPPHTAKPQPKKTQSVRSVLVKPAAELSKCPHCGRGFGVRAFERHVEWCADKARILPAAPTQPAHVAQARHRLNARTQYKAPPVGGRRSLTRDKSSNSRSASVESRGERVRSPPREGGDYRHTRTRASESISSTEYQEESPHVPVIRQSKRGSVEHTAGDAVRTRQRLARDLSSNSNPLQEDINVRESKTDPCVFKNMPKETRNKISPKKQQQLNRLKQITNKHSGTIIKEESKDNSKEIIVENEKKFSKQRNGKRPSQIPKRASSKSIVPKVGSTIEKNMLISTSNNMIEDNEKVSPKSSSKIAKNILTVAAKNDNKDIETKLNADTNKATKSLTSRFKSSVSVRSKKSAQLNKESTISLDSLDNSQTSAVNCHSIGINTEKLSCPCVPCVIHDNNDQKRLSSKLDKKISPKLSQIPAVQYDESNEQLQVLYKNTSTISSSVVHVDSYTFDDETEQSQLIPASVPALEIGDCMDDIEQCDSVQTENDLDNLATDHISSETYTKSDAFNPTCFDEFMDITDKLMTENVPNENNLDLDSEDFISDLHTPNTESIEYFDSEVSLGLKSTKDASKNLEESKPVHDDKVVDSISELKEQLKEILIGSSSQNDNEQDGNRNVCAMEHITIYELQTVDADELRVSPELNEKRSEITLPSISENNKVNNKVPSSKKKSQKIRKNNTNFQMLRDLKKSNKEFKTYIVENSACETSSDIQSVSSEVPPFKLPRIDTTRLDDDYDPFLSAARQMRELMSSDTNIPKKIQSTPKDPSKTLPYLRNNKEKSPPLHLRLDNSKTMKDAMNKNTQQTPILQRMKSFGSSNNDYNSVNTFGGRSSSFRVNRNDKKSSPKLNTTFTKSSKENVSTLDKSPFSRTSSLNKSFSSYTSNYRKSKSKDKPVLMTSSLHHSFQRTVKPPNRLEKIEKPSIKKDFVNLDSILADDNSSTTDSHYIDPRLINENDNLPINVNTILNNPDIISSMESLLNTDNLPAKFESFKVQDNKYENNSKEHILNTVDNSNVIEAKIKSVSSSMTPTIDDLSAQYDKIMTSLEQSIASKVSVRDDDSLCEDFDLEEFMTSFDEELDKQKSNKRSYSSTTRVVKASNRFNSNGTSELNSISSSPKIVNTNRNGLIPFNKSNSMTFSHNNVTETVFPSSVKRSTSLIDSFQKKTTPKKTESYQKSKSRNYKAEEARLEQDIMQSLKEFDKFYESEKVDDWVASKETHSYSRRMSNEMESVKKESRMKNEKKAKCHVEQLTHVNGNHTTPNGKSSNDSAYSSLNRISPSKLTVCNRTEGSNMSASLERAGSDSGASQKEHGLRAISSDEFLALERSTETLDRPLDRQNSSMDKIDLEQRAASRASSGRHTPSRARRPERRADLSSSSSESLRAPPPPPRAACPAPARLSRFCHECGSKFPVDTAKFCIECGVRRLAV